MWSAWQGPGLGHLRLAVRESGAVADGLVLGVHDGRPFRLSYQVRCDPYWRVRAARVGVLGEPPRVELFSDGEGNWSGSDGEVVSYLKGCEYVDISETPFTNTLPIRRLGLAPCSPGFARHRNFRSLLSQRTAQYLSAYGGVGWCRAIRMPLPET
jgi:hypothetical protein